jgi:endoglycosylceramidase
MMTEWGDSDYSLMSAMVQRDDRSMVPWLEWSYCPCRDPTGAPTKNALIEDPSRPPTGHNLNSPALGILVEPYPQVIAGTPSSWGFSTSTRTFTFKYSTMRAGGRGRFGRGAVTVIATPALVYRGRYAVRVSGGAIVSRRGASLLQIAACRGARSITVTVTAPGRSRGSCRLGARAGRRRGSR